MKSWLPDRLVAKRYKVDPSTIYRWDKNKKLGFPRAIEINNHKYRDESELDAWDASRVAAEKGARDA